MQLLTTDYAGTCTTCGRVMVRRTHDGTPPLVVRHHAVGECQGCYQSRIYQERKAKLNDKEARALDSDTASLAAYLNARRRRLRRGVRT